MAKGPVDIEKIRLEARLGAIENILAGLYHKFNLLTGVSKEQFAADCEKLRQTLQTFAIPGIDPAVSDLLVAEMQQAHEDVLKKIADSD